MRARAVLTVVATLAASGLTATAADPAGAATLPVAYVSPSGSDGNSGTTPGQAWQSLARVQTALDGGSFGAGSQLLFQRGGRYQGGLTLSAASSGAAGAPLVLGAYGTGPLPVLTRAVRVTGWTQSGADRWTAACPGCTDRPAGLSLGSVPQRLARWPNPDQDDGGFRYYTGSSGRTALTDTALPASPSWVGGEVVVRSAAWVLDRLPITARNGSTLTLGAPATYPFEPGYGYFIQDHPAALDLAGEWVYDSARRSLTMASTTDPDLATVEVTTPGRVLTLSGAHDVAVRSLELSGGGLANLAGSSCQRVTVSDVTSRFTGGTGIALIGCQDSSIGFSRVRHALDVGIDLDGCARCRVHHSTIRDIALLAGLGGNDNGHYVGVRVGGPGDVFEQNRVDGTGYLGIDVRGTAAVIRQNVVRGFNRVKVDGGGIYTWHGSDLTIVDNLVGDSPGSTAGIPWNSVATHGIYIDDDSARVQIRGNTVTRVGGSAIYLHNTRDVTASGNTLVGPGEAGIQLTDDDLGAFTVTGNTITGNTVVLDAPAAIAIAAQTSSTPPNTGFLAGLGTINANTYCGVFSDPTFQTQTTAGPTTSFLAGWRSATGKDAGSRSCSYRSPTYRATGTVAAQRVGNGGFDTGIGGWFGWPDNALQAAWDPAGLNAGSLRFANNGANDIVHIDTAIGPVAAGSVFRLRFTSRSDAAGRLLRVYLRQAGPPYRVLSPVLSVPLGPAAATRQLFLPVPAAEPDALLIYELDRAGRVAWLDDVSLQQVTATPVTSTQVIRLETNPTATPRSVLLDGSAYSDPSGASYPAGSTVSVPAYRSLVLLRR
jgi:parallel beta-helix repeat protein